MKYKCIRKLFVEDTLIMSPGDIVVIEGNQLYNITSGLDCRNILGIHNINSYIELITDPSYIKTDEDRFKDIIDSMLDLYKKKNSDYGNSFEQSLDEEGLSASRIRLGDKWNRFKELSKNKTAQVNNESVRDTLIDMANYAILTVIWLDKHTEN